MKKQVKKPAKAAKKAAAPKIKLIDGQYSHKFLTRWHPKAGEVLERLTKQFGEKSWNPTVMRVFESYEQQAKELQETKTKLYASQTQVRNNSQLLDNLKQNFKLLLSEPKPGESRVEVCESCGHDEFDDDGDCEECGHNKHDEL